MKILRESSEGTLTRELFRCDNTGRTALCLAQAEQKDLESDRSYEARKNTAKTMVEWLQDNIPHAKVEELTKR